MGINQREMIPRGGDKKPTGFYCTKKICLTYKKKEEKRLKIFTAAEALRSRGLVVAWCVFLFLFLAICL